MKGSIPVKNDFVSIRGVMFPVGVIHDAMFETGGIVVSEDDINSALDAAVFEFQATKNTKSLPGALFIEAIPGIMFVPKRVRLHTGVLGTNAFNVDGVKSKLNLYFAVNRKF